VSSAAQLSLVERRDLGAFYTPDAMASFAVRWAIRTPSDVVLDPGCGDAAFLKAAAVELQHGKRHCDVSGQLFGIDLNAEALRAARRLLRERGIESPTLLAGNFFDFGGGSLFGRALPSCDAVVGNPPYVRYQLFKNENRNAGLRAAAHAGVILPQLTSSWAPYLIHSASYLKEGGRLAMVLPGELLHVGYAAAVRTYLLQHFSSITIIAFEEKVFPGAMEEVVILLAEKGGGTKHLNICRLANLVDLEQGPERVLRGAVRATTEPGQRWISALFYGETISRALNVIERAKYRPLGEFGRVDIGVVTGANDFFVLNKERIAQHKLPFSVLIPAISKAVHVAGARFTINDWSAISESQAPAYLVVIDKAALYGPAERYVNLGVTLGLPSRYKCRMREPWYRVPYVRKPELFLTYMSHIAPRLVVNEAGATHTNTIHGVFLSDPLLAEPLAAAFLNSATLLSCELEGRSYGGGVLKLEPGEAVRVLIPKLTPRVREQLTLNLSKIDGLVRAGQIEDASLLVDRIVLGKKFARAELEEVRSVLSSLRARRMSRSRTS